MARSLALSRPDSRLGGFGWKPAVVLCGLIRFYQAAISPLLPRVCRFYPSCSEYMRQAIVEFGVLRGMAKGCRRLLRCHPFCTGGYDPVRPDRETGS